MTIGDETVDLEPPEYMNFEVEYEEEGDTRELEFELEWEERTEDLEIGSS
ncbi:amphi-Trp domain-containing protein [Halopiger xanaduensis]|nr:amphi-Trp domain-containing protein [Halopiger xanaduensis]